VLIYNSIGQVEARVWSPYYGNIATLRKQQTYFVDSPAALQYMAAILTLKMQAKADNLVYLGHQRPKIKAAMAVYIQNMLQKINDYPKAANYQELRTIESTIAKWYWTAVSEFITPYTSFTKREHQGARQHFNVALNYSYGILYGVVESSILMAGLDPYMGIMHANQYLQPVLAFDLIEPFRAWVDKMVIDLFITKQITESHFTAHEEGCTINSEGRKILISTFFDIMEERSFLQGKRIKNIDHIHHLSRSLVIEIKKTPLP
jgi:CRISPR-associated protein Cas1